MFQIYIHMKMESQGKATILLQNLVLVLLLNFLYILLTSCLTAIKSRVIRNCETVH